MTGFASMEVRDGIAALRPSGSQSLVDVVDLVSRGIAHCSENGLRLLLVNTTGLQDLPIPTLLDRFLMAEDWAHAARGRVTVALVASPEYVHPRRFGVKVATHFGLTSDVFGTEEVAISWLLEHGARAPQ